jgi:IS5 family transposase
LKPIVEVLMIEAAEVGGNLTRDRGVDGDTDGLTSLHNFRTARHKWGACVVVGLRSRSRSRARAWTRKKKKGKKDGLVHGLPQSLLNTDLEAENQAII